MCGGTEKTEDVKAGIGKAQVGADQERIGDVWFGVWSGERGCAEWKCVV